jgi:predicted metal-dependent hydrolase
MNTKSIQHTAVCASLWLGLTALLSAQTTAANQAAAPNSNSEPVILSRAHAVEEVIAKRRTVWRC